MTSTNRARRATCITIAAMAVAVTGGAATSASAAENTSAAPSASSTTTTAADSHMHLAVTTPSSANGKVTARISATGSSRTARVSMGLPQIGAGKAHRSDSGSVTYSGPARGTDAQVRPVANGFQTLIDLKSAAAAHDYRFPVHLPKGGTLEKQPDGSVAAVIHGHGAKAEFGRFTAPWAKDAAGKPIPTSYTVQGNTLVQHVEPNKNTTFPVVADPHYTWGTITGTVYFNRQETTNIAHSSKVVSQYAQVLPEPFSTLIDAYATLLHTTAQHADALSHCVKIKTTGSVGIYGGNDGDGYCK